MLEPGSQIWWVQRTLFNFGVQLVKSISVVAPPCHYDKPQDEYDPYSRDNDDGPFRTDPPNQDRMASLTSSIFGRISTMSGDSDEGGSAEESSSSSSSSY